MSDHQNTTDPVVYSDEAIDMFLQGDRRQVDRLILTGMNSMVKTFLDFRDHEFRPHAAEENEMKDALGSPKEVEQRRLWLDLQIRKEMDRSAMRDKILEATLLRVIPVCIFVVFMIFITGLHEHISTWLASGPTLPAIKDLKK